MQFAEAGSVARTADRLHRTPSAVTRQVQRLEAALGATLLDRSVKPPRLTPLGARIVEQSRDLLRRVDDLKGLAMPGAEPTGRLRIGVSHALADGGLVRPVQRLSEQFPKLRLRVLSDLTGDLFDRLLAGELDLAVVLLPEGRLAPAPLTTEIIATDRMLIVAAAHSASRRATWSALAEKSLGAQPSRMSLTRRIARSNGGRPCDSNYRC